MGTGYVWTTGSSPTEFGGGALRNRVERQNWLQVCVGVGPRVPEGF